MSMWKECEGLQEELVKMRRELHQIPEFGLDLPETQKYVTDKLDELGIPYKCSGTDSSIIAEIKGGQPGKTVALRADMDALKITEANDVDYKSKHEGLMHACGHDNHITMLLGAAKVLNAHKAEIKGNVRLLFQTAEELSKGAEIMIKDGAMDGVEMCIRDRTNVAYPFSTICLAIALLVGIGSASRVSLCLGRKEPKAAAKAAGNGIVLMGIFGIIYLLVGETFLSLLLKAFGATTDVFPYAKQYASITLIGMPFLIVTNGMSNLIRADGKPKYSMVCMVVGAIINTILDPVSYTHLFGHVNKTCPKQAGFTGCVQSDALQNRFRCV